MTSAHLDRPVGNETPAPVDDAKLRLVRAPRAVPAFTPLRSAYMFELGGATYQLHIGCCGLWEAELRGNGCAGSTPVAKRSVQRVYFFGGETLMSFVTLTTPSVSFASRSASALACSFGTVPFR